MPLLVRPFRWRWLAVVALLIVSALAAVACASAPKGGNPSLPAGFRETPLPDVALNGYMYFRQEKPVAISLDKLVNGYVAPQGIPGEIAVARWMVWVGPFSKDVGIYLEATDPQLLRRAAEALENQQTEFRHMLNGNHLLLYRGDDDWTQALRSSVAENRMVKLEEKHRGSWELVTLLPEEPAGTPVAAGFGKLNEAFQNSLEEEFAGPGGDVKRYASAARVSGAAFALYEKEPILRIDEFSQDFLKKQGLGAVLVAKTGYPGFIVRLLFGSAASRAGLTKHTVGEHEVYYAKPQDVAVFVKNQASIFFVALSPDEAVAEALIQSAIRK